MRGQLYDPDGAGPLDAEVARVRQAEADALLRRPPLAPDALAGGVGIGATIGSVVPGIGTAIGAVVGGLIGSIFGGGPDTPTEQETFISSLRSFLPDQNAPLCGLPLDLSSLNGGNPLWLNVPCDDPNLGNASRSTFEWWIKKYGLGVFLAGVKDFLSSSPSGKPLPGSETSGTGGISQGLDTLTGVLGDTAKAIHDAITGATDTAEQGVQKTTDAILGTLTQWTSQMSNFGKGLGDFITSGIGSLLDKLFNPGGGIVGAIEGAIRGLEQEQTSVFGQILGAIERDVSKLEEGLLGLPISIGDILRQALKLLPGILVEVFGGALGPLKDIAHWIEILTGHMPGKSASDVGWGDFKDILQHVADAAGALAGVASTTTNTVYKPADVLTPGCKYEELADKWDKNTKDVGEVPDWVATAIHAMGTIASELMRILPTILQWEKIAEESTNAACPITKLGPSDVIGAVIRGYLSHEDAILELKKQGINESRIKVLGDLARYLENPQTIIDQWWRNILSDDEVTTLLQQNAYSDAQIEALKRSSFRITSIGEAVDAFNRGLISDDQFGIILTANRFDDVQIDLARLLRLRPPSPQEALRGTLNRHALGITKLLTFPDVDTVPDYFTTAGHSAGLNDATIQNLWWAHYNFGDIGTWITSYFRGLRLYSELVAVSESFGVTETYLSDLLEVSRPLIPFRTIPAMITAGIIDDTKGKELIRKHGFSVEDTEILIKYAHRGNKSSKATTAQSQHTESLSQARSAYDDGLITQDQYVELLKAHGLDDDAATLEMQLANISQETKARKQISTDIINEYQAGLIDQQTATQQLATSGLTIAEQAKALKTINSAKSAKGKIPSEAELRAFRKADIITSDEYVSELETQGYSKKHANWFLELHFPVE